MKKPFQVGDRVRVYSAESERGRFVAKVLGPYGDAAGLLVDVEMPDGRRGSYYRAQLRRLVKKKRREWWIEFSPGCQPYVHKQKPYEDTKASPIVHVREVLEKKK